MAWQQKPVAEVTVPNPATGRQETVSSTYLTPASQSPRFASSSDSVTVTMKWTLVKQATESCIADNGPRSLVFIDVNRAAVVKSYGSDPLKKAENGLTVRLPKGKYAVFFAFDGAYGDLMDITKMDGLDNVEINADTTLNFSGSKCTKKIEMRIKTPNGDNAAIPFYSASGTDYSKANIESGSIDTYQVYLTPQGRPIVLSSIFYNLPFNSASIGLDRTHGGDLFANPDIPDCFGHYVMYLLRPLDKSTNKVDPSQSTLIGSRFIRPAVHSGTYTHEASGYKAVKMPKVNKSLYQPSEANANLRFPYEITHVGAHTPLSPL